MGKTIMNGQHRRRAIELTFTAMPTKVSAMTTEFEYITPEIARALLDNEYDRNRKDYGTHVAMLAKDMEQDRFEVTHQPIAIDVNGKLIDGKHRLLAIIASGKPQWLNVSRNVPTEAIIYCDQHRKRNDVDSLYAMGVDATNQEVACAAGMITAGFTSGGSKKLTFSEKADAVIKHRNAWEFVAHNLGGTVPGITVASVRSVIERAYYTADHGRLELFCHILKTGEHTGNEEDNAALRLRNRLLHSATGGFQMRRLTHRRTEYCLRKFLDRQPVHKVLEASEELFPIPGEDNG